MVRMKDHKWLRLLAYVTGMVNEQLLLQNEYLAAENRILRAHLPKRLRLSDEQRSTLAEIGKRLGRKALSQVACVAKPDTILAWYRRLIAQKFDGSKYRSYPGRPPVKKEIVELIVKMAGRIPSGATIGSSARWPISDTLSRIERWAMFFAAMELRQHLAVVKTPRGRTSSPGTWR